MNFHGQKNLIQSHYKYKLYNNIVIFVKIIPAEVSKLLKLNCTIFL